MEQRLKPQGSGARQPQTRATREIVGTSPALRNTVARARRVAGTSCSVLITGETGTGKELFARFIHDASPRSAKPFVAINCAGIPAGVFESELFGHERGAFTGAVNQHIGAFEQANGGTLFLDEIGDLALELQAKLLRAIQEREIRRVGSTQPRSIDFRGDVSLIVGIEVAAPPAPRPFSGLGKKGGTANGKSCQEGHEGPTGIVGAARAATGRADVHAAARAA